jgi:hypothetical protein
MENLFTLEDHLALSAEYLEIMAVLNPEAYAEEAIAQGIEVPSLSSWYDEQNS